MHILSVIICLLSFLNTFIQPFSYPYSASNCASILIIVIVCLILPSNLTVRDKEGKTLLMCAREAEERSH